jgi:nucleotide-binding universal stress UspA family protein
MIEKGQSPKHRASRTSDASPDTRAGVIVVPLDGSAEAKAALPAARLVARLLHASVHVVYVTDQPLSAKALLRRLDLEPEDTGGLILDQMIGAASDALIRFAEEERAVLIVMTTRGHTAYRGRTVRPVVERIISRAPCPVLLVRPEIAQRVALLTDVHRILLPLDGAPLSAAVIAPALDFARQSGAEVGLLYVTTSCPRPTEPGTLTTPLYVDQPQLEWPAWVREFVERFGTCIGHCLLPAPVRLRVRIGAPADEILHHAVERDSSIIDLEWRCRLDPAHAHVVKGVLAAAPCPVLLIRTRTDPLVR